MSVPVEKLNEIIEEKQVVLEEGWKVKDMASAVYADQKIHAAKLKMAEIDELAAGHIAELQAKIEKIKEWAQEAKKDSQQTADFFSGHLAVYLKKEIDEQVASGKKKISKSIKLPFNTISYVKKAGEIKKDDEQLLAWLEDTDPFSPFIDRSPKLKWGELKKALKQTEIDGKLVYVDGNGEVVPHIEIAADNEEFKLKGEL